MKKATVDLFTKIFKTLEPPPDLTISQWADRYRRLSGEAASKGGVWDTDAAPYQREIMNAISDTSIRKVVVMSAAQIGKTDAFLLNTLGYYIHYDPCPILLMQPTLSMAETFSKDRLMPMVRDTPVLRSRISDKARTSGNTIFKKSFPGGRITMTGANSPTELRSRPIRILLADEIDGYPATAGVDGDPLVLGSKRLTTFWNRKEVYVSTPTVKGISRIAVEYENSTQEEWNVPCPSCGEYQPLTWGQIQFDRDASGEVIQVSHVCKCCGVISSEYEWKAQFIRGKYIAKYPHRKVRGFHLNSFASTLTPEGWKKIVKDFLVADEERKKGNIELFKAWTNTELGETWEEEGQTIEDSTLLKRRQKYNCEVPEDVIVLTAGIDTQDNRFEIEVVGWGIGFESWGIQYKKIYGDPKLPEVWNKLDEFLLQTFEKKDGTKMKIRCACMDSGGHFPNEVYTFCKARYVRGIFAIKGKGGADVPYIPRPTKNNRVKAWLFSLGVDTGKSLLLQRLLVDEEGAGYCHFPRDEKEYSDRGYDEEYFKGLTAEKMVLHYKKGRPMFEWELKQKGMRNEPLDCRNYAQAAAVISGATLKEKKPRKRSGPTAEKTQETAENQAAGQPRKKRKRVQRSGGI